jgi:hypothetical protein
MADRADGQVELKCAPETESAVYAAGFTSDIWTPTEKLTVPTLGIDARDDHLAPYRFAAKAHPGSSEPDSPRSRQAVTSSWGTTPRSARRSAPSSPS